MSGELALSRDLLAEIKTRVRQAQQRAALSANAEMIRMYWDIGRMIAVRQEEEGWGAGVIPRLSAALKNELPEEKGFSPTNLKRMTQFFSEYPRLFPIGAQPVPPLPPDSRDHADPTMAITNFDRALPEPHAGLAQGLLKDPYLFDFLTLEEPFHERELETGLLTHIQKFLLELGQGFAFVGRQYRIEVSDREFYLDLLFYHLHLRCFVVVDLKRGDFQPEFAGKMNFYCSAVDDLLRHGGDAPTLGLILCQTKDRIVAEYALRDVHKPIGIADYELTRALPAELESRLPSIESIETELSADLAGKDQGGEP